MGHTEKSNSVSAQLHCALDSMLEDLGILNDRPPDYGAIMIEVKYENGQASIKIIERSIQRIVKG